MVRMRKITKRLYLVAGIITLVIFLLGIILGIFIEGERVVYIEDKNREQKINFDSLQLQYLYLSTLGEKEDCLAFSAILKNYIEDTEKVRFRLEGYLKKSSVHTEEFELLKRSYVISQLNYWILSRKTKDLCDTDFVTVLYFYSNDCRDCENQGYILEYLKKVFSDKLLIFSLDAGFGEEPIISVLTNRYNITETPTIILNDKKFVGFTEKGILLDNICSVYRDTPIGCDL